MGFVKKTNLKVLFPGIYNFSTSSSSSSSSSSYHVGGSLVDPFWSHISRSLFNGQPIPSACWHVVFYILRSLLWDIVFGCCGQFLEYSCILSKPGVIFSSFAMSVFVLWSVQVYPALFLKHFVSAVVILLASLALMVKFSLPYNKDGTTSVIQFYSYFV